MKATNPKTKATIDQWSLASNGGIKGLISNSPNPKVFQDGDDITTSKIVNQNRQLLKRGDVVTTRSGSVYVLGVKKGTTTTTSAMSSSLLKKQQPSKQQPSKQFKPKPPTTLPSLPIDTTKNININNNNDNDTSPLFVKLPKRQQSTAKPLPPQKKQKQQQKQMQRPKQQKQQQKQQQQPKQQKRQQRQQEKEQSTINEDKVPVLENWSIDRKQRIVGMICNSPKKNEPDGKIITTQEIFTDLAFAVEGFTVFTNDGRKYKLGAPKQQVTVFPSNLAPSAEDDVVLYGIPTLADWDIIVDDDKKNSGSSSIRIIGMMKNTNDRAVPNGQIVQTGYILTNPEFLDEGFSIVTESGKTYKLGRRDKNGRRRNQTDLTSASVVRSPPVSSSSPPKATAIKTVETQRRSVTNTPSFLKNRTNNLIRLNEWSVTSTGGITGIISDSQDPNIENGETLTTSTIKTKNVRDGMTVETVNGSLYLLGTRSSRDSTTSSSMQSLVSNDDIESSDNTPVVPGLLATAGLLYLVLQNGIY